MQARGIGTASAVMAGMTLLAGPAPAQLPSNASVQGAYYFRYLGVNTVPSDVALVFQGTINFDGTTNSTGYGAFTVTGQGTVGAAGGPQANNTYKVLSNGLIDFTNPLDVANRTTLFGGVGSVALALSSTDTNYCDLFVGVPVSSSNSAANLNGKYYLASLEFLNGSFASSRNTFFTATFDGKGSLGNVTTINGTAANLNSAPQSQTSTGATYTVAANGTGTLNFPAPSGLAAASVLLSGNKQMYVSPDGSFFVAGGSSTYDFVIGVKALTGSPAAVTNGLYFTAFLEESVTSSTVSIAYGEDGSANIGSTGIETVHQRVNPDYGPSFDATYAGSFQPAADGTVTQSGSQYAVGAGGNIIIGSGRGTTYQLNFYVKAPALSQPSGTQVFLNPQQVYNAANSVPFTASVAPGEFITLGGAGLASQTAQPSSLPFPVLLGGAQVNISWIDVNGLPQSAQAPLSYASPTQINALVPYSVPGDGSLITFQVTNNGVPSNSTRVYSGPSSPGIFTIPSGGTGNGAIEHADYSLVSTSSPAKVGETVLIYLTGLGLTKPTVTAGAASPTTPLAQASVPSVRIGGQLATVVFSGLTPGAAGLYQLNVTIPPGVTAGANATIEIALSDNAGNLLADNIEATIPISK